MGELQRRLVGHLQIHELAPAIHELAPRRHGLWPLMGELQRRLVWHLALHLQRPHHVQNMTGALLFHRRPNSSWPLYHKWHDDTWLAIT